MSAITFDLTVADTEELHPKGVSGACADIATALRQFAFERLHRSVYVTHRDDMANLFSALPALKALLWFSLSVRDIRGFRIENWSDFTPLVKDRPVVL